MSKHSKPLLAEDPDEQGGDFQVSTTTVNDLINPDGEGEKKKKGRPKREAPPPRERKPIEIRSGLLKGIFCHFDYDHSLAPNVTNGMFCESEVPAHMDLINAFKKFEPHLAIIFGAINKDYHLGAAANGLDLERDPIALELTNWKVHKFELVKYGDEEGIIFSGTLELATGIAQMKTPLITFLNSKYDLGGELRKVADQVIFEIEEYLHGRKKMAETQIKMEFNHEEAL